MEDENNNEPQIGNLYAMNDSMAQKKNEIFSFSLSGTRSIIGRSIVVHAKKDDYISKPCGNAGGILAEGIIGMASD